MEEKELAFRIEDKVRLLEQENTLLNSIIQGASDSIYAKDLHGRYISINQAGAEYLGLTIEKVIGKTDVEILGKGGLTIRNWDRQVLETVEPVVYESQLHLNGKLISFWTSKSPLKDPNGNLIGLIGVTRDITETKNAQDKYHFMFENAPIGFWEEDFSQVKIYLDEQKDEGVTDFRKYFTDNPCFLKKCIDAIRIINVNQATLTMNGTTDKADLIKKLRMNFVPGSEKIYIDEFVALSEGKTFYQSEGSFINQKGKTLAVQFNLNVMPGKEEDLSLVLVSVIDLTEIKKMETELSGIRMRYQSIVDEQTTMICRLGPNGIITFRNRAFKEFFTKHDLESERVEFFSLFPVEEVERSRNQLDALSAGNLNCVCELRTYTAEGEMVWQSWSMTAFYSRSGVLLGYQAMGSDITEKKLAEEELAASEARWRSVFEQADDLIMTVNSSGLILSINAYKGLEGIPKWAGSKIDEVLSSENSASAMQLISQVFTTGKPKKAEFRMVNKNSENSYYSCTISPIFHNTRVISVMVIARNITDIKALEKHAKESLIEGQENERTRVSQELHDGLGQLFTVITFNLQHLKEGVNFIGSSELKDHLTTLEANIGTAIKEVKNISRNLMPDVLEQFGLEPAMQDLINAWKESTKIQISLELVDMETRMDFQIEKGLFRISQELINNSVKHGQAEHIFVQVINHEESVILMVEDDGVGYDPETVNRGFGLKNIQSRAELLDGSVEVDTAVNKGTVTTVEIPLQKIERS